ncbi:UDP-glucuronic acid decarboxylase family protein [Lascolabacillus sp.]|uniref:UDP-glucuronic acid decarboxylase family protein n=1 Tax=Lascolabacillus sp. TaxID=1924068 RepID=UPI00258DAC39|nr:UDP-glucuronic acid decarboxylase family protein [Lascolabacillus sp.]MDD2607322.1 SDR family oxidoreductase [Lascolabacillus sp.]
MKRVLVTGGAGFIGSHLCERLLREGNRVICLDNFHTGKKENIAHLMGNRFFELVEHDIMYAYPIDPVDEIYHLACPASPVHYQRDPIRTMKISVLGSYNVLGMAKLHRCKILLTSTSEIYGDPLVHPQPENYWGNVNTIGPRSCYDEGKRAAETLFMDYYRQEKVRIKIVRIFNTYGPGMLPDDGRVISNFILQALQNKDITIYGDGTQTRSFQYIDDLIEGLVRMMETGDHFTGPVNIGNPGEFTIRELAEQIISLSGSASRLVFHPLPADDPKQRRPDITLAREVLSWEPTIQLREGLLRMISYFRNRLEAESVVKSNVATIGL